jgi:opacity protein-like surface antigen
MLSASLKIIPAVMLAALLMLPATARAEYFGVGIHVGAHHNVGNLDSYDPSMQIKPQTDILVGCAFKTNLKFFFIRAGIDTTFLFSKGEVLEVDAADPVTEYRIQYSQIPCFAGLNFPVQDIGEFYMGGGIAYLLATGSINHGTKEDISASALGYGFLCGMQLNITSFIKLYMEWEYIDARSAPMMNTQTSSTWKNMYIDFSGHRMLIGAMYYLL